MKHDEHNGDDRRLVSQNPSVNDYADCGAARVVSLALVGDCCICSGTFSGARHRVVGELTVVASASMVHWSED